MQLVTVVPLSTCKKYTKLAMEISTDALFLRPHPFIMHLNLHFLIKNKMASTFVFSSLQPNNHFINYTTTCPHTAKSVCSASKLRHLNTNSSYVSNTIASSNGHNPLIKRKINGSVAACGSEDSKPEKDQRALETVLKLYEAMGKKNVHEISDVIAEECSCVSNFVSTFKPFHGKEQVLGFFSSVMRNLGSNMEFVVHQTSDDGMVVGVSWRLEWNKASFPLGKGFSIHMCHVYQGKVMIKNVEIFLEPLLYIEPIRLKVIALVTNAAEKLNYSLIFKNKAAIALIIFSIILFAVAMLY